MTYLSNRLTSIGIPAKAIKRTYTIPKGFDFQRGDKKTKNECVFFESDDKDNIKINYFNAITAGQPYRFRKKANKWEEHFVRTRFKEPSNGLPKYISPKESGLNPFFPPNIIDKYIKKTAIETLTITEGEIKAFKGDYHGWDIIGIPSIHGFYSQETKGKLHEDIQQLIIRCDVKYIVFLTDADTMVIEYAKDKDLSKRQASFFSAVKYFRESLESLINNPAVKLEQVYFSHIKTKYNDQAKGLDDLLVLEKGKENEVYEDLKQFQFAVKYFQGFIITDGKLTKVYGHFGLTKPEDFYHTYKSSIGSHEFRFRNRFYEWDGEHVKYLKHEDTDKYMRIGADWMKEISLRNKHEVIEKSLVTWKIGEIKRDYAKYPDFLDNVPKYDGFCSYPDFSPNYKRVHYDLYNIYSPCVHTPKEGSITTTEKFLKHIFGGEATLDNPITGDTFTVAIDYLTLMFTKPRQMLPVPILVSKEFGTGKSTFLKWLQSIYVGNTAILNNDLFKMPFNSHYITKYIIAIDESFLDVDKKAEKERLKQLVTADTAYLQNKGIDVKPFNYYAKIILCSNDEETVMKMEDGEDRWFVIKVPVPKEDDPDLEFKLEKEISAWLYYICNREIHHKKDKRFWFKKEHIVTEQYQKIVEGTKTRTEKILEEFISDLFLTFGVDQIEMNHSHILDKVNRQIKYKMDVNDLRKVFEEKRKMIKDPRRRFETPLYLNEDGSIVFEKFNARPWVFDVQDWLDPKQMEEFKTLQNKDKVTLPF